MSKELLYPGAPPCPVCQHPSHEPSKCEWLVEHIRSGPTVYNPCLCGAQITFNGNSFYLNSAGYNAIVDLKR
jgi:hypothetical protein